MKKLIYSVWTLAVMMLAFASCNNDDAPEEVQITFKASLAQNANSRALSDGSKINKVKCEVYEEVDNQKIKRTEEIVDFSDNKAEYKPTLLKGRTYTAVFFAYTEDSYCVSDLQNVTRLKNECNDETMDAFSKVVSNVNTEVAGSNLQVTLTRPLAQLNFATTQDDITQARKLLSANGLTDEEPSVQLTETSVKISSMSSSFNVWEGTSNNVTSEQELERTTILSEAETIKVNGEEYIVLATAYLFPGETTTCNLNVFAKSNDADATEILVNKNDWALAYTNVPLLSNTRTNVIGSLMTGNVPYKIALDVGFTDPDKNSDENGNFPNEESDGNNEENNNQ